MTAIYEQGPSKFKNKIKKMYIKRKEIFTRITVKLNDERSLYKIKLGLSIYPDPLIFQHSVCCTSRK